MSRSIICSARLTRGEVCGKRKGHTGEHSVNACAAMVPWPDQTNNPVPQKHPCSYRAAEGSSYCSIHRRIYEAEMSL